MKKKLMLAAFWLLLLGPNLLYPFIKEASNGTDQEQAGENTEKRELAAFPVFSLDSYDEYPKNMESYINDHAAFRSEFLSLNATLNLKLFQYADAQDVVKGKDGWYFFTGGSALSDCLGTNRFSSDELAYINSCVQKTAEYFSSQGIDFLVVLPPNKSSVYRQYLPGGYEQVSDITKGEELSAYLTDNSGVPIVDPKSYFQSNQDYLWYYKTDTHWNAAGGYAASQMIIEALGGTPIPVEDVTVHYTRCKQGDLANLFHMPEVFNDDVSASILGYLPDVQLSLTDANGNGGIVYAETKNAHDDRHIAFYRDSFGTAIADTLPKYFKNVDFYHWQSFDASLLKARKPDVIIYEVAERDQGRIPSDMKALAPEAFASEKLLD